MTPEKAVENKIKKALEKENYYFNKNFGGGYSKKGIPDIIGVGNSQFFAIEVKRVEGGNPTPIQIKHLKQIAQNGGLAYLACGPEVVDDIKTNHGKLESFNITKTPDDDITVSFAHKLWNNRQKGINAIKLY